jgi:hypothetical protein
VNTGGGFDLGGAIRLHAKFKRSSSGDYTGRGSGPCRAIRRTSLA